MALAAVMASAQAAAAASSETIRLAEFFIRTPTAELPPEGVEEFLQIDAKSLPKKMREKAEAKKVELLTLKGLQERKKRGLVRIAGEDCAAILESGARGARTLLLAGYQEIAEDEEAYIVEKTRCTEREQMCEFSLQIVVEKAGKKGEARRRYFLYGLDPLMALVAQYRAGAKGGQTPFFGTAPTPVCSR